MAAAGAGALCVPELAHAAADKPRGTRPPAPRPWWLEKPMRLIQTNLREIDADLDLDVYMRHVRDCAADVVLFNVGGIVCNYPTRLEFHWRNPHLEDDLVGKAVRRLHAEGLRVIGRFDFSKINEKLAAKKPEWLYVSVRGEHVNYNGQVHTCINGGYQQQYMFRILDEALDRYPLDGVFFNMIGYVTRDYSGNYHGICKCDACRKRFREFAGQELPRKEDTGDAVFRRYQEFRRQTSDELFRRVQRCIRGKREGVAVCTYTPAGVDVIRRESNSALDRPLPEWNYSASDNVKTALGSYRHKAVSNAAVHFVDFPYRHAAVSPCLTELRLAENLASGGWLDYYCIGPLERQEDRRTLDVVGELFRFHRRHERWLADTRSLADVCLVKGGGGEYCGMFRILAENHVLFDVLSADALAGGDPPGPLEDYPLLVLPDVRNLSDACCRRLDRYVAGGGRILATGRTSTCDALGNPRGAVRLKCCGVEEIVKVRPPHRGTYFRIRAEDRRRLAQPDLGTLDLVYLDGELLECRPARDVVGLLRFIPTGMYGPPEKCYYTEVSEIPGLLHSRSGRGSCALFPWQIGRHYRQRSHHGHALLVMGALEGLLGLGRSVRLDASPMVEVTRHVGTEGTFEWIGLVNHSGQNGTAFHPPVPIDGIRLQLRARRAVQSVRLMKADAEIEFSQSDDGWTTCVIPRLHRLEIVLVRYA